MDTLKQKLWMSDGADEAISVAGVISLVVAAILLSPLILIYFVYISVVIFFNYLGVQWAVNLWEEEFK